MLLWSPVRYAAASLQAHKNMDVGNEIRIPVTKGFAMGGRENIAEKNRRSTEFFYNKKGEPPSQAR